MSQFKLVVVAIMVLTCLVGTTWASELGAPAPPLEIREWVKGNSVSLEQGKGKNIFVVQFWATWCPYCLVTIPYLEELQKRFADEGVVIVGVTKENPNDVKQFFEEIGHEMNYVVAADADGKTSDAYLKSFGVDGIPYAFVVDRKSRIIWQGHPLDGLDSALEAIVKGKYDLVEEKRVLTEKKRVEAAKKLLAVYALLARNTEERDLISSVGDRIYEYARNDADVLDDFAWFIVTDEEVRHRQNELAYKAIKRAYEVSGGTNSSVAETYARVLFEMGRTKEAIVYQRKAILLCQDEEEVAELKQTLKRYLESVSQRLSNRLCFTSPQRDLFSCARIYHLRLSET
ncbi:MAG: TlpA family protein disulfide reductase [Deltaproteobacteria bacterium]|nr:TlpA family protein disulfide reductase [Deltaproteobacteria bacterium]